MFSSMVPVSVHSTPYMHNLCPVTWTNKQVNSVTYYNYIHVAIRINKYFDDNLTIVISCNQCNLLASYSGTNFLMCAQQQLVSMTITAVLELSCVKCFYSNHIPVAITSNLTVLNNNNNNNINNNNNNTQAFIYRPMKNLHIHFIYQAKCDVTIQNYQLLQVDRPDFSKKRRMRALLFTIYYFFSRWPLSISNQTGHQFFSLNPLQTYFIPICCMRTCVNTNINRVGYTKKICW